MGGRFSNVVPHRAGRWVNCTWLCCNKAVGIPWTMSRVLWLPVSTYNVPYPLRRYAFLAARYHPMSATQGVPIWPPGWAARGRGYQVPWYLGADPRRWDPTTVHIRRAQHDAWPPPHCVPELELWTPFSSC